MRNRPSACFAAAAFLAGAVLSVGPATADEFTDVLESALAAYGEGDMVGAREDLDYAVQLLAAMKSEGLAAFLPAPLPGWTKEAATEDASGAGAAMAMFGGGTAAAARYLRGEEEFTLTLIANSPMVTGISAMVSGLGGVAGAETRRIQRTQFMVTGGEIQGVVADKVMITASGSAQPDDIFATIEAMDLRALGNF